MFLPVSFKPPKQSSLETLLCCEFVFPFDFSVSHGEKKKIPFWCGWSRGSLAATGRGVGLWLHLRVVPAVPGNFCLAHTPAFMPRAVVYSFGQLSSSLHSSKGDCAPEDAQVLAEG